MATRIADRLVYGRRATPYQVLSEFSDRVAGTYASDDVLERMAQVLADRRGRRRGHGVAARVGRVPPRSHLAVGGDSRGTVPTDAIEVRHQDEVLGALSVRMPANDPMEPAKERLIRDLAAQAGSSCATPR